MSLKAELAKPDLIQLTPKAVEKTKEFIASEGKTGLNLRVTVQPGGCAGFTYGLDLDDNLTEEDFAVPYEGFHVVVDKYSAALVKGSTIDYTESLEASHFTFNNPNSRAGCGCGKSFS